MTAAMGAQQPLPRRPGRPRSDESRRAILQATLELLAEGGFGRLTMSGVAARAGASTATVYRWWRSKLDLVVDAATTIGGDEPAPDTGSLRGDLRAFVLRFAHTMTGTLVGQVVMALIGDINHYPELADALRTHVLAERLPEQMAILERGVARGEVDPNLDLNLVMQLLMGPVYVRLLVSGEDVPDGVAGDIADLVIRAVAPRS
jgi:AcrR family transcriptional regulator